MIARLIRWSAHNLVLILLGVTLATGAGIYAVAHVPLDAIPDLSDTQVIIYTEYGGQAPQVVEDQVTFPLSTAMLSVPRSHVVRGFSFFGVSFVYVIFDEGTDIYWARSRVLEYLSAASKNLPAGVTPTLGPDATGVGWVYQYAVMAAKRTLAELRTTQDWQVRFAVAKAEGVAEVASVGGFVRQYSVVVDPRRLKSFDIPLTKVKDAIRASNMDVGGRVVELAEKEFMVRGRGYLRGISDIEQIVLKSDAGTPVLIRDVARVELAPDERRGVTELNGEGEVVSGIAVQRFGQNSLSVIANIKARLADIKGSLPAGTEMVVMTMREALRDAMAEEMRRDGDVLLMGEEVAQYQGAYKVTQGLLKEFGDNSVNHDILVWIADPEDGVGNVQSEILNLLWALFRQNEIEIPFPQRDIHIRSTPATVDPLPVNLSPTDRVRPK